MSHSCCERSTRLKWPACSAPMVGTKPTDLPVRWAARTKAVASLAEVQTGGSVRVSGWGKLSEGAE